MNNSKEADVTRCKTLNRMHNCMGLFNFVTLFGRDTLEENFVDSEQSIIIGASVLSLLMYFFI
ncbi:MAG: hypothetical protein AB7V56_04845 [Candidatus Nitrosocosmicus sp.]